MNTQLKSLLNNSDTAQTEVFGHLASNANCWKDVIIPAMLDEDVQKAIVKYFDEVGTDDSSDEHLDIGLNSHHQELVEVVTNFIEGEDGNSEYPFDGYLYEIFMDLAKEFYVKKWYLLEETQQKLLEKVINSNTATHEVLGKVVGKSLTWKEFLVPLILDPIVQEKVVKFFGNNPEYLENDGSLDREQMILEELDYFLKDDYPRIDNRYEMNVHTADVFMSLAREFYLNNWYEVSTDDGDTVTVFLNRPEPILSENILHIENTSPKTQRKSKVNKYSYDRKELFMKIENFLSEIGLEFKNPIPNKLGEEFYLVIRKPENWFSNDPEELFELKFTFGIEFVEIEDSNPDFMLSDKVFETIESIIDQFLNGGN